MPPVVIDNPILNSPFAEPSRHFKFDDDGITSDIGDGRRLSTYFIPIPPPKKKGGQLALPGDWVAERMAENNFINKVREHVALWRATGHPGITTISRELLDYWNEPDRERRLFFCQIEALETAIFLAEVGEAQAVLLETIDDELAGRVRAADERKAWEPGDLQRGVNEAALARRWTLRTAQVARWLSPGQSVDRGPTKRMGRGWEWLATSSCNWEVGTG